RIGNFIDAVAEAHDELFRGDEIEYASFRLIGRRESFYQLHGCLIGAAVQRAAQRADGAGYSRIKVGYGRGDRPRGEGGGVEFVFGIENERYIDGAPVQVVGLFAVDQMEKVAGAAVIVGLGLYAFTVISSDVMPVDQDGTEATGQPIGDGDLISARSFSLQRPEHGAAGPHDVHRMRAAGYLFKNGFKLRGEPAQSRKRFFVIAQFALIWQTAVDEEIGDFLERRVFG